MANETLTQKSELITPSDNDVIYIVDISDTTESTTGTSKKIKKSAFLKSAIDYVDNQITSSITNSTALSDPTISIVPLGNVHILGVGSGTYPNWGGMVIPANNIGTLRRVDGIYSVSLTPIDLSGKVNVSDVINDLNSSETTKPGSADSVRRLNQKFADYAKTTDLNSKANLVVGKNIFNWEDSDVLLNAIIGGDGVIYQDSGSLGRTVTGFIPVKPGQTIAANYNSASQGNNFYNANKVKTSTTTSNGVLTVPSGAFFLRKTVNTLLINLVQIEIGSASSAFEPYKLSIPIADIPEEVAKKTDLPDFTLIPKLFTGKNKFNKLAEDVTLGSYVLIGNGNTDANALYNATGYMPVTANLQYTMSHPIGENAWYDANKFFIVGFNDSNPVTAPVGAAFARCTVTAANWNAFQFEQSAVITTYENYLQVVKNPSGGVVKADSLTANAINEAVNGIPNNSIIGAKVVNNSITGEKTTFFEGTKNLFNYLDTDIQLGKYLFSTGQILDSDSASVTGFIPISAGQTLFCNQAVQGGGNNCQYDINKNFIPGSASNSSTVTGVAGAAFAKFTIRGGLLQTIINNLTQVEVGTAGTFFVPFTLIKKSFLPTNELVPVTDLQLPSTLYMTNVKTDLFFEAIAKNYFKKDKFVRLSITNATLNRHFTKLATITPSSNGVATFKMYDTDFKVLSSKTVNTVVTSASKTGILKTMFMGSSITYGAKYIEYIKTICGSGVTFLGTRRINSTGVLTEGRGGWGLGTYFQKRTERGIAYNGFYHPTTGRHWGSTAYWADVMSNVEFASGTTFGYDQDGFKTAAIAAGFLSTGKIAGAKLLTNDVMYDNALSSYIQWNGTSWITITEPTTWGLDFVKYSAMWTISAPDLFFIAELATNDFRGSETDPNFTNWNAQVEQVISALKIWNASIKVAVTINFSTLGGDHGGFEFQERNNYRMWQCRKNVIENFDNRVGEGIYLIDNGIGFDQDFGFEIITWDDTSKPNELYTGSEKLRIQYANPHPNVDGNNLLGKCLVGIIQLLRA